MLNFFIPTPKVYAAVSVLEASGAAGSTAYTANISDMFESVRKMEASGGTLGKSETFNSDWTPTSNNGLDCHLSKNTEWGTVALLMASSYGAGASNIAGTSTTETSSGNATGIVGLANGNWEYTASLYNNPDSNYQTERKNILSADGRYKDVYSDSMNTHPNVGGTSIAGDALECRLWLNASRANFIYGTGPVFLRGNYGVFGFDGSYGGYTHYGRAVVVCGADF